MTREVSSIGVVQHYGPRTDNDGEANTIMQDGNFEVIELDFDYLDANAGLPALNQNVDASVPLIPAGSVIVEGYLQVGTAFTSGGSATLEIGTQQANGTAIDADGLDSLAVASLTAGSIHVFDGALIGAVSSATLGSQISVDDATAVFTAGTGKIVVKYLPPYGA